MTTVGPPEKKNEIRVRFSPSADDRFRVQFTDAAGNALGVAGDFTPLLAEDDYENLRWYLEDYLDLPDGGAVTRVTGIEQQLHQWGRRLYAALFADPKTAPSSSNCSPVPNGAS